MSGKSIRCNRKLILEHGSCPSRLFTSARTGQARIATGVVGPDRLRQGAPRWPMADLRKKRPYTDYRTQNNATGARSGHPRSLGRRAAGNVWFKTPKKGPPQPIGKEFKPISRGAEHIRNVIDKINSDKRTSLVCGVQFIPKTDPPRRARSCALLHRHWRYRPWRKLVDANLRVASIHANKRAGLRDSYNDLLGAGVKAMLKALEDGKFDPSRGTRLSTFFEYVVNGDVIDHLIKENLYSSRHALCSFLDDHDDTPMDGEPVEKAAAVQLAVEAR